jgi:large subunit ribosomal protein L30e
MNDLKKALKEGKLVFGTNRTMKLIKNGKAHKVYLAKNCNEDTKKEIIYYGKLAKIEVKQLDLPNEEIGMVCKKPFAISVLCY